MLVGPRRHGKTSFAKHFCLNWQERKHGEAILLDVYNVSTHQDFLLQLLYALQTKRNLWEKVCGWIKHIPERMRPNAASYEHDDFGKLTLKWLAENDEQQKKLYIQETLESLAKFKGQLCFVIDECQQLSRESINDDGWLEATLRQHLQQQVGEVAYMLTGSRRDVVHGMINDSRRPLYRAFNILDFPPLEPEFTDWILERFAGTATKTTRETIDYLRQKVADSPNYVQMVCYHLVAMGCDVADKHMIDTALINVTMQNAYSYETHLHNLSPHQQRVLRMLALEEEGYFSEVLLRQYEIASTAYVTNAIHALKKKNILDQEAPGRGRVSFDDPLFKLWLRHKFGGYASDKNGQLTLLN